MTERFNGRREDPRLLTGQGSYTADHSLPGQAWAAFLRSDVAHAVIRGIDTAEAEAAEGVLAVLTGADMEAAGYRRGVAPMPFKGRGGSSLLVADKPALATDRVRYVGEPMAIVVAETEAQARDALDLIVPDLEGLEVVPDMPAALAGGAPLIHDEIPGNTAFTLDFGDAVAVEAAIEGAAHRVRITLESPRLLGNPMEPKAVLARWDGDILDLWSPSQGITPLRGGLAAVTGLGPDQMRLHAEDVGGAFGVRGQIYPEYTAVALAAKRVGRPVKWVSSRSESILSDYQGRGLTLSAELGLDAEGRFVGIRHDILADMGGHVSAAGPVTAIQNPLQMAFGAYAIPAVGGTIRLVLTNRTPVSAYRGAVRPDMAYVVERLVDEAARQTGFDRIDLRRRNMIPVAAFPYDIPAMPAPTSYDSADFGSLIDAALARADWDGFDARRAASRAQGKLRGLGCALFIEPAGGGTQVDQVALTWEVDGMLTIHTAAVASGQGHETVFPEMLGAQLGMAPDRIRLKGGRSDSPRITGGGAFGSRSMMAQGSTTTEAGRQMLAKARSLAAELMDLSPEALSYDDGLFSAEGSNRSLSLADIAAELPGQLDTMAELPGPRAFPSGMHVAEVEIDPETGACALLRYTSVDDCGTVMNKTLVEGQIIGGLAQGLGQVFGEMAHYDGDAQLLSGSFMDYPMPRADLMHRVDIELRGVPSPGNLLGAKGVGEAGTVGSLPAAMNAVMDALAPEGVAHLDMPATPARIWGALIAAGKGA
ncbi:xanthine dehydrogenase family protein molybdopterin-binding subunit [Acidimangrovimonas sediminis]|uniref:xanthine dehydrogenase family protein molybdopterin-binding subunit n=1 Tax=Acidimangrovimonas sediminis TaxID=2056283 RepID=UPI001304AB95|nr:xanthine dehydrogenase family protein molybdopterin-binding subunit [Acidimangrovimonas sediminis]